MSKTDPTTRFDPDVPPEKQEPLADVLEELVETASDRLGEYEDHRADVHWRDDDAYRHVEHAHGELSNVYWLSRNDAPDEEMMTEAADALNHLLMALDIGSTDHVSRLEK